MLLVSVDVSAFRRSEKGHGSGMELQKWQVRATRTDSRVKHASTKTRDSSPLMHVDVRIDTRPTKDETIFVTFEQHTRKG
jgi:hypothetical protein